MQVFCVLGESDFAASNFAPSIPRRATEWVEEGKLQRIIQRAAHVHEGRIPIGVPMKHYVACLASKPARLVPMLVMEKCWFTSRAYLPTAVRARSQCNCEHRVLGKVASVQKLLQLRRVGSAAGQHKLAIGTAHCRRLPFKERRLAMWTSTVLCKLRYLGGTCNRRLALPVVASEPLRSNLMVGIFRDGGKQVTERL